MSQPKTFKVGVEKTKTFNATLKKESEFSASVNATILQSKNCYKGTYATLAELETINAFTGDYADVYEYDCRFVFENGAWHKVERTIPIDPRLVTQHETSVAAVVDTVVRRDNTGGILITEPVLDTHAASKGYVDRQDNKIILRVAGLEDAIANPKLVISLIE